MSARVRIGARPLSCAVLALAALALAPAARAQTKTGTTLGQFLMIEPSARIAAMGNAGVAFDGGLEGVYYNAAAGARATGTEILFSHAEWFAGIRYDYVAAAFSVGSWGRLYGTITSLGSGEIDVRTVDQPLGTGERFTVSDVAIGLGYARPITERFAAGLVVRYVQESIWHNSASTVTFDVATSFRVAPNGLRLGSSLSNYGTSATFDGRDLRITYDNDPNRSGDNGALPGLRFTQDYAVPVLFRVGLGMPYRINPDAQLWFAVDAAHPSDNSESVSGGVELVYRDMAALRLGYQSLFEQDSEEGLTFGAGFHGNLERFDYRLDYAWAGHQRLDSTHRLGLGVSF